MSSNAKNVEPPAGGTGQISSLDDPYQHPPDERTPLLRQEVIHVNEDEDSASEEFDVVDYPRPWVLVILYHLCGVFMAIDLLFLFLLLISLTSPFFARNTLPPHFGSSFLPIWLMALSSAGLGLARFSFTSIPLGLESDDLNIVTHFSSLVCAFIQFIIVISVGPLRHKENVLTLVLLALTMASALVAVAATLSVVRNAETPLFPKLTHTLGTIVPDNPVSYTAPEPEGSPFVTTAKKMAKYTVALIGISLPMTLLHIAIIFITILLFLNTILTAYDSSLQPEDGHLWRVNPWKIKFDEGGRWTDTNRIGLPGRPYRVHLYCKGVNNDVDDLAVSNITVDSWGNIVGGAPHDFSGGDSADVGHAPTRAATLPKIHRTILVESDRGVTGHVGGAWVKKMLRDGKLTDGDVQVRVCYWDRPGYGFSDNSPSASIPHVVRALTQALSLSGELARLGDPNDEFEGGRVYSGVSESGETASDVSDLSANGDTSEVQHAPSPFARSGFILVGDAYGALHSALFAALRPRYIHSMLYLAPIAPSLYYSHDAHNFHSIFGRAWTRLKFEVLFGSRTLISELGIFRWISVFRHESREKRIHASASEFIRPEIERTWLAEEKERHNIKSESAQVWETARHRYPERPTIVLSQNRTITPKALQKWRKHGYTYDEWASHEETLVKDVIGSNLLEWQQNWDGTLGDSYCEKALKKLVKLDVQI